MKKIVDINTVTDLHRALGLESPEHPLISVLQNSELPREIKGLNDTYRLNLYLISLKTLCSGKISYGRSTYDFQEGTLIFTSAGQVMSFVDNDVELEPNGEGWSIIFHPDFIRNSPLAESMGGFSFFNYEANEALHVSDKEKQLLREFVKNISQEIGLNIDKHSQELININLESILKYSSRYYDRQFYTRTNHHKGHLVRFERYLKDYFNSTELTEKGLPSVDECGKALNMSGHYLSDLLKVDTGKSAREHIHLQLIDKAKNKLLGSREPVSQIAYDLGFDYPQHFSKLFKTKTGLSPSEYRNMN